MPKRQKCATCGKVLSGPVRGGRVYCGPACWPSRPVNDSEIARLQEDRRWALARIEAGISPMINTLAVRRIDQILADRSVQRSNGGREG